MCQTFVPDRWDSSTLLSLSHMWLLFQPSAHFALSQTTVNVPG